MISVALLLINLSSARYLNDFWKKGYEFLDGKVTCDTQIRAPGYLCNVRFGIRGKMIEM